MSKIAIGKWLKDKEDNLIAPKTYMGQVLSDDGTTNLNNILDNFNGGDEYSTSIPTSNAEYWLKPID